jgi:toxin ParE1/3/4
LEKYDVKMLPKALRDIDDIFDYIADELIEPKIAEGIFSSIEDAILSLDEFPYRGSERKVGVYANKGYRQLFVKNFTIIYRVDEILKQIIVVTVRYSPSHF